MGSSFVASGRCCHTWEKTNSHDGGVQHFRGGETPWYTVVTHNTHRGHHHHLLWPLVRPRGGGCLSLLFPDFRLQLLVITWSQHVFHDHDGCCWQIQKRFKTKVTPDIKDTCSLLLFFSRFFFFLPFLLCSFIDCDQVSYRVHLVRLDDRWWMTGGWQAPRVVLQLPSCQNDSDTCCFNLFGAGSPSEPSTFVLFPFICPQMINAISGGHLPCIFTA